MVVHAKPHYCFISLILATEICVSEDSINDCFVIDVGVTVVVPENPSVDMLIYIAVINKMLSTQVKCSYWWGRNTISLQDKYTIGVANIIQLNYLVYTKMNDSKRRRYYTYKGKKNEKEKDVFSEDAITAYDTNTWLFAC